MFSTRYRYSLPPFFLMRYVVVLRIREVTPDPVFFHRGSNNNTKEKWKKNLNFLQDQRIYKNVSVF
jgi:hypothetical protein